MSSLTSPDSDPVQRALEIFDATRSLAQPVDPLAIEYHVPLKPESLRVDIAGGLADNRERATFNGDTRMVSLLSSGAVIVGTIAQHAMDSVEEARISLERDPDKRQRLKNQLVAAGGAMVGLALAKRAHTAWRAS